MSKTSTYAIVAVVIIIIVIAGVAAWYYYGNTNNNGNGATPTPTPGGGIADASSLSFKANVTNTATGTTEYNWQGVNIHSSDLTIRLDFVTYGYIMNASSQESWNTIDSGTTWTVGDFTVDWPTWGPYWTDAVDNLTHWNGSDATYSFTNKDGDAVTVFDIVVNPTIPDSTFNPT